jgi:integrase
VRDIFSEAVEQDFLVKDPARKVTVPSQLRDTDKTTLINVGTATECAFASVVLRPSGIENVRIRDRLQRLYSALGQTKKSLGRVHLPKELADDLWLWKQECPASSPEAFIFPDAKGGFMDTGNYRRRVLHKLAKDLELPKLTFQVIRRTIATLAQKKGTVKGRFQAF